MPRMRFTYTAASARKMRDFEMRMSANRKPNGIASGNAASTMATDIKKPPKMMGRLLTMSTGLKNRRKNVLEFHASTQGCSSRKALNWSNGVTLSISTAGMPSTSCSCPSASV